LFGALDAWVRAVLNALVATVSLAFWPAQKQINPASGDWIEICTTQGSSWVQLDLDRPVWSPVAIQLCTMHNNIPYCGP